MTNHVIKIRQYIKGEETIYEFPQETSGDPDPFPNLTKHAESMRRSIQCTNPAAHVTISAIETYAQGAPLEPCVNGEPLSSLIVAAEAADRVPIMRSYGDPATGRGHVGDWVAANNFAISNPNGTVGPVMSEPTEPQFPGTLDTAMGDEPLPEKDKKNEKAAKSTR